MPKIGMKRAIMMKIDNVFYGSKEDWLNSKEYVIRDIFDDCVARSAVCAIDKWIAKTPVTGIEELT